MIHEKIVKFDRALIYMSTSMTVPKYLCQKWKQHSAYNSQRVSEYRTFLFVRCWLVSVIHVRVAIAVRSGTPHVMAVFRVLHGVHCYVSV